MHGLKTMMMSLRYVELCVKTASIIEGTKMAYVPIRKVLLMSKKK